MNLFLAFALFVIAVGLLIALIRVFGTVDRLADDLVEAHKANARLHAEDRRHRPPWPPPPSPPPPAPPVDPAATVQFDRGAT